MNVPRETPIVPWPFRLFGHRVRSVLILAAVVGLAGDRPAAGQEPTDRAAADEGLKGRIFFYSPEDAVEANTGVFTYDLETRKWQRVLDGVNPTWNCRVSPDGRSFVLGEGEVENGMLVVRPEGRNKVSTRRTRAFWSSDGRQLIVSEWDVPPLSSRTWRMNADGTGRVNVPVPEDELVIDASPDGRWFLIYKELKNRNNAGRTNQIRRSDGTDSRPLIENNDPDRQTWPGRFSPDGRSVAYVLVQNQLKESNLWVIDREGGAPRRVLEGNADGFLQGTPCWSPDGKFLAIAMTDRVTDPRMPESFIEIVDLNGRRIRRLGLPHQHPTPCDWH